MSAKSAPMCAPSPPPNSRPCWATRPVRWSALSNMSSPRSAASASTTSIVELDGPEAPIGDGSARAFVAAIDQVGIVSQRRRAVTSRFSSRFASRRRTAPSASCGPTRKGFRAGSRDRIRPSADRQASRSRSIWMPQTLPPRASRARTFGFMRDVAKLWSAGFALGASFENTLVVTENRVLNPEWPALPRRIRAPQGPRRHRRPALRALRCSAPIASVRGGHKLNHAVLSAPDGRSGSLDYASRRRWKRRPGARAWLCRGLGQWPRGCRLTARTGP